MARRFSTALLDGISIYAPVVSETACGVCGDFNKIPGEVYEVQVVGQGLTPDGRLIELDLSENGAFTNLVATTSDTACVTTVGTSWGAFQHDALDLPKFLHRMRQ